MNGAVLASLALAPTAPVTDYTIMTGEQKGTRRPMLSRGESGYGAPENQQLASQLTVEATRLVSNPGSNWQEKKATSIRPQEPPRLSSLLPAMPTIR
jgi:hypothetical protein